MLVPLVKLTKSVSNICKKDLGIFAPALQKANDPIQQLFVDKLREFRSKFADEKSFPPEIINQIKSEKEKLLRFFEIKSEKDVLEFPSLTFPEPKIENSLVEKSQEK